MADKMGQRERVQGEMTEIMGIREWCGSVVQWKLPEICEGDPNEDFQ